MVCVGDFRKAHGDGFLVSFRKKMTLEDIHRRILYQSSPQSSMVSCPPILTALIDGKAEFFHTDATVQPLTSLKPSFDLSSPYTKIHPLPSSTYPVKVKTLTGQTIPVRVSADTTGSVLKALIHSAEHIPPDQQRLIFNACQIDDDTTLGSLGVEPDSIIRLVLRLRGGMFHLSSGRDGGFEHATSGGKPISYPTIRLSFVLEDGTTSTLDLASVDESLYEQVSHVMCKIH